MRKVDGTMTGKNIVFRVMVSIISINGIIAAHDGDNTFLFLLVLCDDELPVIDDDNKTFRDIPV